VSIVITRQISSRPSFIFALNFFTILMFLTHLCIYLVRVRFDVSSYHKSITARMHTRCTYSTIQMHRKNDVNSNKCNLTNADIILYFLNSSICVCLTLCLSLCFCWTNTRSKHAVSMNMCNSTPQNFYFALKIEMMQSQLNRHLLVYKRIDLRYIPRKNYIYMNIFNI